MLVFLDFEASSLAKNSYPIEVAWVFEDGRSEAHLIRPAPDWTDWDARAEALHRLDREWLEREGTPHDVVARRMVETLGGHDLLASAPSWDGKWLSLLLRTAGLPRHSLRLRDSDDAQRETATTILRDRIAADQLEASVGNLVALTEFRGGDDQPVHRALADAEEERRRWLAVRAAATQLAQSLPPIEGLEP